MSDLFVILKVLTNDPDGDVAAYGEFGAWIIMILRGVWVLFICVMGLAAGIAILVLIGLIIKLVIAFFGLFMSPIPFIERI